LKQTQRSKDDDKRMLRWLDRSLADRDGEHQPDYGLSDYQGEAGGRMQQRDREWAPAALAGDPIWDQIDLSRKLARVHPDQAKARRPSE